MERANSGQPRSMMTVLALIVATLFVICSFGPMIMPLANKFLVFASGDFTTIAGSAVARADMSSYVLANGHFSPDILRFFILGSAASIAHLIPLTDSQFISILTLASIVIGSLGIYLLTVGIVRDAKIAAFIIAMFIPFYFLNPWSTERIVHFWIWITYAVLPMQMALGLMFIRNKNPALLGVYSLLMSAFGIIPHSLIYMMGIHAAMVGYAAASKVRLGEILVFALVPLLIYLVINAPFIFMLGSSFSQNGISYPAETSENMLGALSKYGEIPNLFSFQNNWWPDNTIRVSPIFALSSFFIFILMLAVFSLSYKKMDNGQKTLSLISISAILIFAFIAQGMNNQILAYFINAISDRGLDVLIGPFREWARICIMIPVFLIALFSISIEASKRSLSTIFALALGMMIMINILFSPSWYYLSQRYAPVSVGDTYDRLASIIPQESRVVWMDDPDGIPVTALNGEKRASMTLPWVSAVGSAYDSKEFRTAFINGTLSGDNLSSLGIGYVILDDNANNPYPWLKCDKIGYYKLCSYNETLGRIWVGNGNMDGNSKAIDYRRKDSTRWEARVDSSAPFTLSFAENYLPGWKARVYKNGGMVSVNDAIRDENGIIGFRINDTGELNIRIAYEPQETFELLRIFSIVGILACIAMALGGLRIWPL